MMFLLLTLLTATPDLPWDKMAHGAISFSAPFAIERVLRECNVPRRPATWVALSLTAAACASKEIYDRKLDWGDHHDVAEMVGEMWRARK